MRQAATDGEHERRRRRTGAVRFAIARLWLLFVFAAASRGALGAGDTLPSGGLDGCHELRDRLLATGHILAVDRDDHVAHLQPRLDARDRSVVAGSKQIQQNLVRRLSDGRFGCQRGLRSRRSRPDAAHGDIVGLEQALLRQTQAEEFFEWAGRVRL